MWRTGQLPVPAEQLPTGTVIVHDQPEKERNGAALCARVSSADQKSDLDRQLARLTEYAAARKWVIVDAVKEVGSDKEMIRLLRNPEIGVIVVERCDFLDARCLTYLEAALAAHGRKIVAVDG